MASDRQHIDRRGFLKAAGGAGAAAALAGCTGGDGGQTTTASDDGTTAAEADETETETESEGGDQQLLTYARGNDSGTLDPQATTSGEDSKVINQVYERLIDFKPGTTQLTGVLATEWNREGDTTFTFTLREGVQFHNGEEFTASDFVATYRRFTDSDYEYYPGEGNVSSYGSLVFGSFTDVQSDGDYSLTVELESKYAPFLRNMAVFAASVMSEQAMADHNDSLNEQPVGTGPFAFDSWDKGNARIRLSANGDYYGEGPNVDEVVFTAISQNSTRAQTLDTGGADIIDGIGAQAAQQVEGSDNAELVTQPGINVGYMAFNMARREEFRDKKVRQAVNYAVNTQAIVETIFKGIAVPSNQPIPENVLGYNESLDPYPHDPEKAQQLLNEAGYGDGFSFELATFKNPRAYNPSPVQAAQVIKSNLKEVGIDVSVKQRPFNPFITYIDTGKHDACFIGWTTDNADPDNFFYFLLHPQVESPDGQDWVSFDTEGYNSLNSAGWANAEFMELVEAGQTTYDEATRAEKYKQAAKVAHDEAPWMFMNHAKELRGVSNRVGDFTLAPMNGPYLNLVTLS